MKTFICATLLIFAGPFVACHVQSQRSEPANPPPFRTLRLPVGSHPVMVAATDVNKDGNVDLFAVNNESRNVSVYLGDGKGGFTQANGSPFSAGEEPNDVATADFNGDGNIDAVIANHGVKTLALLLGKGNGQFSLAAGSPFTVESNPHPHGITAADFNGDKNPDIAVESWAENKVLLLFGKGDGTFQMPGSKFEVGKMPYHRLRSGDLNADGYPDIVTSNFEAASVSVLFGDGRGGFTRKDFSVPPSPFGVALADFNGDHRADIATFHYSGQAVDRSRNGISVLVGDGRENFTLLQGSPFAVGHYPSTIAAGDIDNDGIADIVVSNYEDGTLTVYLGGRKGIRQANYSPIRVGRTPHGIAIADFNNDSKGDIVVAEEEANDLLLLISR
jgi:hypothetical protein